MFYKKNWIPACAGMTQSELYAKLEIWPNCYPACPILVGSWSKDIFVTIFL